ncbi:hypothetical protein C8R45DRAFT_1081636 [Mycena sanguinolenta]|nr:hypothetical protein C8R45DRAFT_1081636 [Mycena sanguinolenta]
MRCMKQENGINCAGRDDKNAVLRNYMEGEEELCRTSDVINSTLQYVTAATEKCSQVEWWVRAAAAARQNTRSEWASMILSGSVCGYNFNPAYSSKEVLNFMVLKWGLTKSPGNSPEGPSGNDCLSGVYKMSMSATRNDQKDGTRTSGSRLFRRLSSARSLPVRLSINSGTRQKSHQTN